MRRAKIQDLENNKFRQQPKLLDELERFNKLSIPARYLYGILFDQFRLSLDNVKKINGNNWVNDKEEVYFKMKQAKISKIMNVGKDTVSNYIEELCKFDLLEKERTIRGYKYYITKDFYSCQPNKPATLENPMLEDGKTTAPISNNKKSNNNINGLAKNTKPGSGLLDIQNLSSDIIDIAEQINPNRKRIAGKYIDIVKKALNILMSEYGYFMDNCDLEILVDTYLDKKPKTPSIEHFIFTIPGLLDELGYNINKYHREVIQHYKKTNKKNNLGEQANLRRFV